MVNTAVITWLEAGAARGTSPDESWPCGREESAKEPEKDRLHAVEKSEAQGPNKTETKPARDSDRRLLSQQTNQAIFRS